MLLKTQLCSPQSLFGPEEVKAGFLHVHLKDNNSSVQREEMTE